MIRPSYVYFVRPISLPGPIKIGCSYMPKDRLMQIASWSPFPLELIVTVPGDSVLEANIHDCFFDAHSHREWFNPTPKLLAFLDALKSGSSVTDAIDLSKRLGSIRSKRPRTGAGWTAARRLYMGWVHKVRWAEKRAEKIAGERLWPPEWVRSIVNKIDAEKVLPEEIEKLEQFIASPREFCLTREQRFPKPQAVSAEAAA